jgi:phosphohistidine phosphatase
MKILVIRHADALDPNGNSIRTDFDRPLSEKGLKQALRLKKGLLKADFLPEIVLSSPLIRTSQTSKLVFPEVFTENKSFFERSELKPGAHPEII